MEATAEMPMSVLGFWFNGDPKSCGRKLWFVSDLVAQASIDKEIKDRFGSTLQRAESGKLDHWLDQGPLATLALVIVLDQFSRHVYRSLGADSDEIQANTNKAAEISRMSLNRGDDHWLKSSHVCFLLMPLRHIRPPSEEGLKLVLEKAKHLKTEVIDQETTLVDRFIHATERRLEEIEEETTKPKQAPLPDTLILPTMTEEEKTILERPEVPISEEQLSELPQTALYQTMEHFLLSKMRHLGMQPKHSQGQVKLTPVIPVIVSLSGGVDSMVIALVLAVIARRGIAFSRSSPLHLTSQQETQLKVRQQHAKRRKLKDSANQFDSLENQLDGSPKVNVTLEVHAIHIDYGNRKESDAEARYVEEWCHRHKIHFHKRQITEVRRGVTARDDYERISRDIRFAAYRNLIDQGLAQSGISHKEYEPAVGIMVGHHKGDVQENVISNSFKGAGITELSGMKDESIIENVRIWRPLLPHEKDDVFELAHTFGVPYFKDTTPNWSTRGKLRRKLWPVLKLTYGEGFPQHLSSLAKESDDLDELLSDLLFTPFDKKVVYSPLGALVRTHGYEMLPLLFWRRALRNVCHQLGCGGVHEKPLKQLVVRIRNAAVKRQSNSKTNNGDEPDVFNRPAQWIVLKRDNRSCMFGESVLMLFHEKVFQLNNAQGTWDGGFEIGQPVSVPGQHVFGSWQVTTQVMPIDDQEKLDLEFTKQKINVERFYTTGTASYLLPQYQDSSFAICKHHGSYIGYFRGSDQKLRQVMPIVADECLPTGIGGASDNIVEATSSKERKRLRKLATQFEGHPFKLIGYVRVTLTFKP